MNKRPLGKSAFLVSELSLGCMLLPLDESKASEIIHHALDAGINYFDTADLYNKGENEALIGKILKPYREDVIIATKVGNKFSKDEEGWTWDASRAHIEKSVHESLKRLQTDYIDIYQLHGGTIDDNLDEVIDTFEELKLQGLIREYGISSIRPNVFMPFSMSDAVSNMMQYNMLDRSAEEFFDQIYANGVSVLTRGTLAKGLLTNDYKKRLKPYMSYEKDELEKLLKELSASYDLHALALAFNLRHEAVASLVVGASTKQQLIESLEAYERMPTEFPDEVISKLKITYYEQHR